MKSFDVRHMQDKSTVNGDQSGKNFVLRKLSVKCLKSVLFTLRTECK
jgi:hypothetical protein